MKSKTKYHIGQRFNRLVLVQLHRVDSRGRRFFKCLCDCGTEKIIQASLMSSGNTMSCGCYQRERKQATRRPENYGEITAIILGYQRHAVRRGFNFLLTREFVSSIVRMNCHYCGSLPSNLKRTKNSTIGLLYSGIDRVDSTKDYTADNVVPCCSICNNAKSNLSLTQFASWAKRLNAMAAQWSPDLGNTWNLP